MRSNFILSYFIKLFLSLTLTHILVLDAIYGVQNCIKDFGTWMEVDPWILV